MLENLVAIQARGASFDVGKQQQPHGGGGSLSRTAKKTEQARVDAENTRLLERIIADHGVSRREKSDGSAAVVDARRTKNERFTSRFGRLTAFL